MKKIVKYLIIIFIIVISAFQMFKIYNINQKQIPVLVYHNIVEREELKQNDIDSLTIAEFSEQLKYLSDNGYTSISLDELYNWKNGKIDIPEKSVVITFDDGYLSFKSLAQPILQQYNFKAACFLIGNITEQNTLEYEEGKYATVGLDEVDNKNENIIYGSHTFDMHKQEDGAPVVIQKNYDELKQDIQKFDNQLFEAEYLAYPYYTYTKDFVKALEEENYKLAFAGEEEMTTKNVNNYKIPRISGIKSFDEFKNIFETKTYKNKYGNGIVRKVCIKIKRYVENS